MFAMFVSLVCLINLLDTPLPHPTGSARRPEAVARLQRSGSVAGRPHRARLRAEIQRPARLQLRNVTNQIQIKSAC